MAGRQQQTAQLFEPDVPAAAGAPKGKKKRSARRTAEEQFAFHVRSFGLPAFTREWQFAKSIGRRWRFDFAFLEPWFVAVEIEGLVVRRIGGELVVGGRHGSIKGFKEDCVKYASAAMLGWTVLRFEQSQVKDKTAIEYTMRALAARGWRPDA